MSRASTRLFIQASIQEQIQAQRETFYCLGHGRPYTQDQKDFAFDLIADAGIRATARILAIPRRTLQRWCRQQGVHVRRCPGWVRDWAQRRRQRKEFWQRRGYY